MCVCAISWYSRVLRNFRLAMANWTHFCKSDVDGEQKKKSQEMFKSQFWNIVRQGRGFHTFETFFSCDRYVGINYIIAHYRK